METCLQYKYFVFISYGTYPKVSDFSRDSTGDSLLAGLRPAWLNCYGIFYCKEIR